MAIAIATTLHTSLTTPYNGPESHWRGKDLVCSPKST